MTKPHPNFTAVKAGATYGTCKGFTARQGKFKDRPEPAPITPEELEFLIAAIFTDEIS